MEDTELCTITNKTKGKLPSLPIVSIKEAILGKDYEFGITFVSPLTQKKLNNKYRGKNSTTNILSFPLSETSGEITIDLEKSKSEAHLFNMTFPQFLKYLFIHGCLHLKGYEHSSTMERQEKKFLKIFS